MYYAHSVEGRPLEDWQTLEEHLLNVSELAKSFSSKFNSGDHGALIGALHDLGKYSEDFRERILGISSKTVDHSSAGAKYLLENIDKHGFMFTYPIVGHHGGMPNGDTIKDRLSRNIPSYNTSVENVGSKIPIKIPDTVIPEDFLKNVTKKTALFKISFFIRMLFSCLVDADYIDTELFYNKNNSKFRKEYKISDRFLHIFNEYMYKFKDVEQTLVNIKRKEVLLDCKKAADSDRGLFSLTVPTGGAKTLSSMNFALNHAAVNNMDRIIYVIPFTSIIDQTAREFKTIFGKDNVLEHHSNIGEKSQSYRHMLTMENWNSPIVLTTSVQFFESFYSNKPSKCRKLHNVVNSVIIIDEVQSIPRENIPACIEVVKELIASYNCTVVLCTATQPEINIYDKISNGALMDKKEIISNVKDLYSKLKRVNTHNIGEINDNDLVEKIGSHRQVLCITNTRKHARTLYGMLPKHINKYHLSASMCAEHRLRIIDNIKDDIKNDFPCVVISTQLIEAGVDIDFPTVYRAIAGVDSLAQSAGRCNRNGKFKAGDFYIFKPTHRMPVGYFRESASLADTVLKTYDDIFSIEAVARYFTMLYNVDILKKYKNEHIDSKLRTLSEISFKDIANFKFIENETTSIIVPYNKTAVTLLNIIEKGDAPKKVWRAIQRYSVQLYEKDVKELINNSAITEIKDSIFVLNNNKFYSSEMGLLTNINEALDAEDYII